ncbi:hypothetical protein BU16DRAFT_219249 [Lophium mytilinum]|uniref:Zn(2)-C6 fungal-type domain-containing protein n=1 Tax=Lophium mytilinum TaxID=390894 RepID=A0A6A6QBX1_9PEZI|nr:hypothetical protein BU16DRAFT_219249 [Lophium mytilinum]
MSLPGRPARACVECRVKKVKCDQRVPQCRRCVKKGLKCIGYKTETQLTRHEPSFVVFNQVTDNLVGAPFSPSLQCTFEEMAIPRFFADYIIPGTVPGVPGGFLGFLEDISNPKFATTCLLEALTAASYASLANQIRDERLKVKARKAYGSCLALLNQALRTPTEAKKDATLGAMAIIALYEIIMSEELMGLWDCHYNGRLLLLKIRGPSQLKTARGQNLYRGIYFQMQLAYLGKYWYPPVDFSFPEELATGSPDRTITKIVDRAAKTCATGMSMLRDHTQSPDPSRLRTLLQEVWEIEALLLQWRHDASIEWAYQTVFVSHKNRRALPIAFPSWLDEFHVYPMCGHRTALIWNLFRSTRILIHHIAICIILYFETFVSDDHVPPHATHLDVIRTSSDEICASVPFSLGQVNSSGTVKNPQPRPLGGYFLLWPLHLVRTRCADDRRKVSFINGVLSFINDGLGISHGKRILDYRMSTPPSAIPLLRQIDSV